MPRAIIVVCSDPHGGHRYGLLNPETILEEKDENGKDVEKPVQLTTFENHLWYSIYAPQFANVARFANGDDVVVIFNGDLTQGIKHPSELVSNRMADQIKIGWMNLAPWYALHPRAVRIVTGTQAHNFNFGSSEILITEYLRARFPDVSTGISDHYLLNFAGAGVDVSHHGPPPGCRTWLKGNVARYYLQDRMLQEITAGKKPPILFIRSHYHELIKETYNIRSNGNYFESTILITPSLTFLDDHARQVTRSPSRVTVGMVIAEIMDGKLKEVIPIEKTFDIRTYEEFDGRKS